MISFQEITNLHYYVKLKQLNNKHKRSLEKMKRLGENNKLNKDNH
jgi:hypothetical protein